MMRCIKKIDQQTRSGARYERTPRCQHFDSLLFIRDNVANREKDSNLTLPKSTSENSDFQTAEETFFNSVNIPKTKVTVNNKSVGKSKVTANDNFTTLTIDDSILIKEQLSTQVWENVEN